MQHMGNRNGQQVSPSKLWVKGQDVLPFKTTCFRKYNFRTGEAVDVGFSVCLQSCHREAEKTARWVKWLFTPNTHKSQAPY